MMLLDKINIDIRELYKKKDTLMKEREGYLLKCKELQAKIDEIDKKISSQFAFKNKILKGSKVD